ncbi:SDR family oxidoreductase [Prauserella alba]|uniref:SDR family NAD(P)-dependent oxidoreductase n=1 Tax=Prauserella alba TaxID=176898 RepID=A0ABP4FUI6_9PSEU|nr:SDR family NAD(P)-dependent oxidoreductase [Prauserella alba]MCP2183171.1 3-oxoacyl-[acyl-carrier protein] reductase [Prauserella alba]
MTQSTAPTRRTLPTPPTALVTGGASGIGAAAAARLRADGVDVVTADLAAGADEKLDVTDPDAVAALVAARGPFGILVHSAGIVGPAEPLSELDLDEWREVYRINVDGTFLLCRAVVPGMVAAGWGRIVTMASIAAKEGNPGQSAYSSSKAAVIGLTKSLGKELATTGVLVNAVAPAAVATPMNARTDPAVLARSRDLTPMGRMGRSEEIAELVAWLCSDRVGFSTGAVFDASGGRASY